MGELESILDRFDRARILIVGDLILDQYIWGKVNRISPEAPIPVVEVTGESYSPGGASNVAANIHTLGARVEVCGVIGDDGYGRTLLEVLKEKSIGVEGVVTDPKRPTTMKTRVVAHKQQVVRVDRESTTAISGSVSNEMKRRIMGLLPLVNAVILEDYGKGVIHAALSKALVSKATEEGKFVTVDPKKEHFPSYCGVTAITPNRLEAEWATGVRITDTQSLRKAGSSLLKMLKCDAVLITLGKEGMCLFEKGKSPLTIPSHAREVYDVSGAGDTVIAVFTTALVAGAKPEQAARLSNIAGGLVVEKLGTATVSLEEMRKRLRECVR